MGLYTTIYAKVLIRPEFRDLINTISNGCTFCELSNTFTFLKEFASQPRAEFIPHGIMMDEEKNGFNGKLNETTGVWSFQCSLKSFTETEDLFVSDVIGNIASEIIYLEINREDPDEPNELFENIKL